MIYPLETEKTLVTVAVKVYDGLKHTDDEDDARHLAKRQTIPPIMGLRRRAPILFS